MVSELGVFQTITKQRRIRYIGVCDIDKIWHLDIF